ncbi:ROK family protein [Flavihumibacter sp. CACIAM 22H1]|uniref:ROK family protein n=1 Tax=Flavihumibacter sp. CACIAM 22H1 TaxID=1812911 RepID=UPI0007A80AEA|nr:ROK family protein [Flavihumibacter sp. CACIAM 22H1]KYP15164.1 MAG: sugar kinase [Flavihumibacter sp. CACIAM 22H1]
MIIGVDLGGTNARAGLIQQGEVVQSISHKLANKHSLDSTLEQLIHVIEPLVSDEVEGIGIGVPSIVDVENGVVFDVVNIPSWKKVELKKILEQHFAKPVYVNNDVNCFALGEQQYGSAQNFSSFVAISVGTGLGTAIVINRELYLGVNCGAGEIGYFPYLDKNLEYYSSSSFFDIHSTTAEEVFYAAQEGKPRALQIWQEYGHHLGNVLKVVLYAYAPEAVLLGGSISNAYRFFESSMLLSMDDFMYPSLLKQVKVIKSKTENIALLGAAALVPSRALV